MDRVQEHGQSRRRVGCVLSVRQGHHVGGARLRDLGWPPAFRREREPAARQAAHPHGLYGCRRAAEGRRPNGRVRSRYARCRHHRRPSDRSPTDRRALAYRKVRDGSGSDVVIFTDMKLASISGMAPQCKLVSMKVLDASGNGQVSNMIAALEYIQQLNDNGRHVLDPWCEPVVSATTSIRNGSPAGEVPSASRSTDSCTRAWWSLWPPAIPGTDMNRPRIEALPGLVSRSPSTTQATPSWRSPSAQPTGICRTCTASRTSHRRVRQPTAG